MNAKELKSSWNMQTHNKPPLPTTKGPKVISITAAYVKSLEIKEGLFDLWRRQYFSAQNIRMYPKSEVMTVPGCIVA